MAALAAALECPGIRVFGDQIQTGADRESTRKWIADSIHVLAERIHEVGVSVWLETHGHFASAPESLKILKTSGAENVGVIWDPANCLLEAGESPSQGATAMAAHIRHVHVKDLRRTENGWEHVLAGEGSFPLSEVHDSLQNIGYDGFVSFEWEKKWHPEIADATLALPHFSRWFRENWR